MNHALTHLPQAKIGQPLIAAPGTQVPLVGFSGAQVLLLREVGGRPFVRKVAGGADQNARLKEQAVKQEEIRGVLTGLARTPEVLAEGEESGLYFFDMEYIRGLDGVSFLRGGSLDAIAKFTAKLGVVLERLSENVDEKAAPFSPRKAVLDKCASVAQSLIDIDPSAHEAVLRLSSALQDWDVPDLKPTANHGDMTLENLVVTGGEDIAFIDLLGSYFNHWLTDMGKLGQDLRAGWYLRRHRPLALGVIHYVRKELMATVKRLGGEGFEAMVPVLIAVNLARILPYAKTAEDRTFVTGRMLHFIEEIEGARAAATKG